jgi:hypothetical protein
MPEVNRVRAIQKMYSSAVQINSYLQTKGRKNNSDYFRLFNDAV